MHVQADVLAQERSAVRRPQYKCQRDPRAVTRVSLIKVLQTFTAWTVRQNVNGNHTRPLAHRPPFFSAEKCQSTSLRVLWGFPDRALANLHGLDGAPERDRKPHPVSGAPSAFPLRHESTSAWPGGRPRAERSTSTGRKDVSGHTWTPCSRPQAGIFIQPKNGQAECGASPFASVRSGPAAGGSTTALPHTAKTARDKRPRSGLLWVPLGRRRPGRDDRPSQSTSGDLPASTSTASRRPRSRLMLVTKSPLARTARARPGGLLRIVRGAIHRPQR